MTQEQLTKLLEDEDLSKKFFDLLFTNLGLDSSDLEIYPSSIECDWFMRGHELMLTLVTVPAGILSRTCGEFFGAE